METIDKYVERTKQQTLYEMKDQDSLPRDLFKIGPGTASVDLSRWSCAVTDLISAFPKELADMFQPSVDRIMSFNNRIDGWAIEQSISAEGQKVQREENDKKRGGILGVFSS